MTLTTRRSLLVGLAGAICAPAVVRATSLMPVAPVKMLKKGHSVALGHAVWTWDGSRWLRSWPAGIAPEPGIIPRDKIHNALAEVERLIESDSPCAARFATMIRFPAKAAPMKWTPVESASDLSLMQWDYSKAQGRR